MTLVKTLRRPLIAAVLLFAICSCNNEAKKNETEKTTDTTVATPVEPAQKAFTPFDLVEISHSVKDYDKWLPAFTSDSVARQANGLQDLVVAREIDNPNKIIIVLEASDVKKAKDFSTDPRLKKAMDKGGVNSKPTVEFFHVIRFDRSAKEKKWCTVIHRVKDFDAWLKVYDGEGTAARAAQGLKDVVLARGIDDPNLVQLVFDIKEEDMAKAKAAILSEEKKKLMMSAGVEGKPRIQFYETAVEK